MPHLNAWATGGYFPTPDPVIDALVSLCKLEVAPYSRYGHMQCKTLFLDPCAGKYLAAARFTDQLAARCGVSVVQPGQNVGTAPGTWLYRYGIELNIDRTTEAVRLATQMLNTSFFTATITDDRCCVALVNPPYDFDFDEERAQGKRRKRMEIRFLERTTRKLRADGLLLWLVPQEQLKDAATHLATHYTRIRVLRFSDEPWLPPDGAPGTKPIPMYQAFGQIVVVAQKRAVVVPPDPALVAELKAYAAMGADLPVLETVDEPSYQIPLLWGELPVFEAWAYDPDATARQVSYPGHGVWGQREYEHAHWPEVECIDVGLGQPPLPPQLGHVVWLTVAGAMNGQEVTGSSGERVVMKGACAKTLVHTVVEEEGRVIETDTEKFVTSLWAWNLATGALLKIV